MLASFYTEAATYGVDVHCPVRTTSYFASRHERCFPSDSVHTHQAATVTLCVQPKTKDSIPSLGGALPSRRVHLCCAGVRMATFPSFNPTPTKWAGTAFARRGLLRARSSFIEANSSRETASCGVRAAVREENLAKKLLSVPSEVLVHVNNVTDNELRH